MLWQGRFEKLNDQHLIALERISFQMTDQSKATLEMFRVARSQWLVPRLVGFWKAGIHRQTLVGNIGIWLAAIFRKI
jgi:hypothetical protein